MINVRWYGRGGQGAFTAARLLGQIVSTEGKQFALASPSFGPERRGAPVWSFTRIDKTKILDRSQPPQCDYLIVLDETLVSDTLENFLTDDGVLILNTARPGKYGYVKHRLVTLDATRMSLEIMSRAITNVPMLGAFARISGIVDLDDAEAALKKSFPEALYEKNRQLLLKAFAEADGGAA
ncbi:MAG: 2-oxoacid:acceptor oxidoreductase family protein [Deltaproteobacteria bacterium]|jgi:pyruvate ferredoxin oxidoreductase gamma subunit|nr:2-oxoacid:acceptor oxidoreductase family protein [Deltaproteobacteria bacterium]